LQLLLLSFIFQQVFKSQNTSSVRLNIINPNQGLPKRVFTASFLDAQHLKELVWG